MFELQRWISLVILGCTFLLTPDQPVSSEHPTQDPWSHGIADQRQEPTERCQRADHLLDGKSCSASATPSFFLCLSLLIYLHKNRYLIESLWACVDNTGRWKRSLLQLSCPCFESKCWQSETPYLSLILTWKVKKEGKGLSLLHDSARSG